METKNGIPAFYAASPEAFRLWLEAHHQTATAVWLIIYRKGSGTPSITYDQAVDEALCFGWIDSKPNKRDEQSFYQYFSPRKPKSNWSGVNKANVARLTAEGRMAPAGLAMVELAKQTGTWEALNAVESLEIAQDLADAFEAMPGSLRNWEGFSRSSRRGILEWINSAKTAATRQKRINETVRLAALNEKANQYTPKPR